MSDKVELLPCPFCGEQLHINQRKHNPFARCATPGCTGGKLPLLNIELPDDIAAWNRRSAIAQQPAPAAPAPETRMRPTMQRPVTECGCPDCGSSLVEWPAPAAQEPEIFGLAYRIDGQVVVNVVGDPHITDGMPIYTAPPAAEQPDTVKVPRELLGRVCHEEKWHAEMMVLSRAKALDELRDLLGKEGE